ncbi:MAG: hypothetical protein Kow00133_11290 [Amphiplicatus sp.]|jgi:hypothetical protein
MQLDATQIGAVEKSTDLVAIAEDHSAFAALRQAFGEHTYFVNNHGLYVFRREGAKNGEATRARLFAFAMWSQENENQLAPLAEPLATDVTMDLENAAVRKEEEAASDE